MPDFSQASHKLSATFKQLLLGTFLLSTSSTLFALDEAELVKNQEVLALQYQPLKQSIKHARASEEILLKLHRYHYEKKSLDDILSTRLFDEYIENLDPAKNIFLQSEIDKFEPLRYQLDNQLRRGNLQTAFDIFNDYRDILVERTTALLTDLDNRITNLDFDKDEYISIDDEDLRWPTTAQEREDRQRKSLKNAVLSLKLSDADHDKILETLNKRYRNQVRRIKQLNAEDVFQIYMNSLGSLYDPHTAYMSPRTSENFNINMKLSLEGIGAVLSRDGEYTVVERLIKGGPAELQGELKPKDKITTVTQGDGSSEDVLGWRLDEVVELIRGKKGTTVKLTVLDETSGAGKTKTIAITRNKVKLEEQAAKSEIIDIFHDEKLKRVGIIEVPTFYHDYESEHRGEKDFKSTTKDVERLLTELDDENVDGIILDLRGNGGGYLEEARTLTGLFVEKGPVVQIRHANGKINRQYNYPNKGYYKKPFVVLIDRLSASASEIFAGAMQDYGRALVVGTQSFGKGSVQQVTPLSHGAMKFTEAKYYRISGDSTQHRGVLPDIQLPSLFNMDDLGEGTLDNALNWDQVKPVNHSSYGEFSAILPELHQRHSDRITDDPDYIYIKQQLSLNNQYDDIVSLPLNLNARKAMIEKDEEQRKAIQQTRDLAKGLITAEEIEAENALAAADETVEEKATETVTVALNENLDDTLSEADQANDEEQDPRSSFVIMETANILLDSIQLTAPGTKSKRAVALTE